MTCAPSRAQWVQELAHSRSKNFQSISRGRSRSSCSGAREWGFMGDRKLQGFGPKHTKPCNPKPTKPKLQHEKSMP